MAKSQGFETSHFHFPDEKLKPLDHSIGHKITINLYHPKNKKSSNPLVKKKKRIVKKRIVVKKRFVVKHLSEIFEKIQVFVYTRFK